MRATLPLRATCKTLEDFCGCVGGSILVFWGTCGSRCPSRIGSEKASASPIKTTRLIRHPATRALKLNLMVSELSQYLLREQGHCHCRCVVSKEQYHSSVSASGDFSKTRNSGFRFNFSGFMPHFSFCLLEATNESNAWRFSRRAEFNTKQRQDSDSPS